MEDKRKRKEWIKTFTIIFLAVLLVLTFFSNTIQNYSLPEVAVQTCMSGSITNKVRGQAVVETADPYKVEFKQTRKVESVPVKVGDEVTKGDVLYVLEKGASEDLKAAEKELATLQRAYDEKVLTEKISSAITGTVASGNTDSVGTSQVKMEAQQKKIDEYKKQIENLEKELNLWQNGTKDDLEIKKKLEDAKENKIAHETQISLDDNNIEQKTSEKEAAEEEYDDVSDNDPTTKEIKYRALENAREALKRANDAKKNTADNLAKINRSIAEYEAEIEKTISRLTLQKTTAEENLNKATAEYDKLTGNILTSFTMEGLLAEIEEKKTEIEELRKVEGSNEITAPVSGTILSLKYVAGETIDRANEEGVASIQIAGKGFTMSMSVRNEQAMLIGVGDEADIMNSWYAPDVRARVISIRPDPTSPSTSKKVTFEIEGDVTNGQTLSVTVGKRTASYDNIVPSSAIREDNNGKFVYRIVSKATPLGTRYSVERVDVQVLASDDTQTAVSGAFDGWEYIVTTSSKPIENKQLVRLKD